MAPRTRRLAAALAILATTTACEPNRFVSGWIPYWGSGDGRTVVDNGDASQLLSEVSPFFYVTTSTGGIARNGTAANLQATVASARAKGLPVIPAIADGQGPGVMRAILHDPAARAAHIGAVVDLVTANAYDGIDIDYETFAFGDGRAAWPDIQPDWVAFVAELSAALHARGKLLSVTVPPVWGGGASGYTVYAQAAIAPYVDRLRLMVYDWSVDSPGPIAPISWVNDVISYSSAVVPVDKLQLGVPAYGRHWRTRKNPTEICPDGSLGKSSLLIHDSAALAAAHGVTPTRHSSGEVTYRWTEVVTGPSKSAVVPPTITPPSVVVRSGSGAAVAGAPALRLAPPSAPVTCTVQHTVYVPDATAIRQRADAALAAGWSGIVIWALGYDDASVYQALGGVGSQRPNGAPGGALDAPAPAAGGFRVTGLALNPQFDLPVPVSLTVSGAGGVVEQRTVLARSPRSDVAAAAGPFHGIDETFIVGPGAYQVCATLLLWGGAPGPSLGCQSAVA